MRILFILLVAAGHLWRYVYPETQLQIQLFFGTKLIAFYRVVDLFYIIGGFFLYRRVISGKSAADLIKKTYIRLFPGMLFAFLLCYAIVFPKWEFTYITTIVPLMGGIGLDSNYVVAMGEYFISSYFWCSCLFIGLFTLYPKKALFWLIILLFCLYSLQAHASLTAVKSTFIGEGRMKAWQGIVSDSLLCGLRCIGIGIVAGFLSANFSISRNRLNRVLFTLLEVFCLVWLWKFIIHPKESTISYMSMLLLFGGFLISISHSMGYVSAFLNRCSWIQLVSRYSLPMLFGQMVACRLMSTHNHFGIHGMSGFFLAMGCSVVFALVEYHLIERFVVPNVARYLTRK